MLEISILTLETCIVIRKSSHVTILTLFLCETCIVISHVRDIDSDSVANNDAGL